MTTRITRTAPKRASTVARPAAAGDITVRRAALTWSCGLSGLLAVVAGAAAAVGVLQPAVFRDPAMTAGNARGTALVILALALPCMLVAMRLAMRRSLRAQIIWLGALGYLVYNGALFAFATAFNPLSLAYVGSFALALWVLVALLIAVNAEELRANVAPSLPVKLIAGYLLGCTVAFGATWLGDIIPALLHNGTPASLDKTHMLTNPIEVMDLRATLPLCALTAVWLWQRRPWGYLLAGLLVSMLTIESASIAVDQWFGHRSDSSQSLGAAPLMVGLTLIGLVITALFMRHPRAPQPSEAG